MSENLYVRPGWIVMREHDVRSIHGYPGKHGAVSCAESILEDKGGTVYVMNDADKITRVIEVPAARSVRRSAFAEWREGLFRRVDRCPTCGTETFPRKDELEGGE